MSIKSRLVAKACRSNSEHAFPIFLNKGLLLSIILILSFALGFCFFIGQVSAQEEGELDSSTEVIIEHQEGEPNQPAVTGSVPSNELEAAEEEVVLPEEVLQDAQISPEDLGATNALILPDSRLHALKRIGWKVTEALTFDTVKDAELKLKHANQQLYETKQLIDKKGIENIDPRIVADAIDNFENKLDQVKDTAGALKQAEQGNPQAINKFLDEVTDKQLTQQKVLDVIGQDALNFKKQAQDIREIDKQRIESLVGKVHDTKDQALENFTQIVVEVDQGGDSITDRIEATFERQAGSNFKSLKDLEFLDALGDKMPETVQEAIERAKKNAREKFEKRIKQMPPVARAEKLKTYVEHSTGDDARLLALLEEIKQSPTLPDDILQKMEKVKEIVVNKFENKLKALEAEGVREKFLNSFDTDDVSSLIALEDLKNRMHQDTDELRLIEETHKKSAQAFREKFKDLKSQDQAARFEKLTKEMMENPSPKVFKLMDELEMEVVTDPAKREFLDKLKQDMQRKFEDRFIQEGDQFINRVTTLDPKDIAVFEQFDFDPILKDAFVNRNAQHFKNYMQDINEPEEFDRFNERFFDVPEFVINEIKRQDNEFQDAMQFKLRKMEEQRAERERDIARSLVDYQEREFFHQMDRVQQKKEQEFWEKFNGVPWDDFETRKELWAEKTKEAKARAEESFKARKQIFEDRLKLDPWCDEVCLEIQYQFLEQDYRHEKERLADDLSRERKRIEAEKVQHAKDNPLFGKCNTPESCDEYCRSNPDIQGCEWAKDDHRGQECEPPAWWDFAEERCKHPDESFTDCFEGHYWDYKTKTCVKDPYWHPPDDFKDCDPGMYWNDERDLCEYDDKGSECGSGRYWDYYHNECRDECPPIEIVYCPNGKYYKEETDHRGCIIRSECFDEPPRDDCSKRAHPMRVCSPGEEPVLLDPDDPCPVYSCSKGIICPDPPVEPCPPDHYRESYMDDNGCWVDGECIRKEAEQEPYHIFRDGYKAWNYDDAMQYCKRNTPEINQGIAQECRDKFGIVYEQDTCRYNHYNCKNDWECRNSGFNWCNGECQDVPCEAERYCGDGICDSNEDSYSCAKDCGGPCPSNQYNDYTGDTSCSYSTCPSGCISDSIGCPKECYKDEESLCKQGPETCETERLCRELGYYWCRDAKCYGEPCPLETLCGDGKCEGEENDFSCPDDCGEEIKCGNGVCDEAEDSYKCPQDCAEPEPSACKNECGNGVCQEIVCLSLDCPCSETIESCPEDCGSPATAPCAENEYNNYTGEKECNYSLCSNGCNYDSQGCPVSCYGSSSSCSSNAAYCTIESECTSYNFYWCNNACQNTACDAGAPNCGNGTCESGETTSSCPSDCSTTSSYCGDEICDSDETIDSCPADCQGAKTCSENEYNNYTGTIECNYSLCPNGCNYDSQGCPVSCYQSETQYSCASNYSYCYTESECTSNGYVWCNSACFAAEKVCSPVSYCGDGICDADETQDTCSADCGEPAPVVQCGNNICETGEDSNTCPTDCGQPTPVSYCGDGTCDADESQDTCSVDCGEPAPVSQCGDGTCDSDESLDSCPADCGGIVEGARTESGLLDRILNPIKDFYGL